MGALCANYIPGLGGLVRITHVLVIYYWDYCNEHYMVLPKRTIQKLLLIQNPVRVVMATVGRMLECLCNIITLWSALINCEHVGNSRCWLPTLKHDKMTEDLERHLFLIFFIHLIIFDICTCSGFSAVSCGKIQERYLLCCCLLSYGIEFPYLDHLTLPLPLDFDCRAVSPSFQLGELVDLLILIVELLLT